MTTATIAAFSALGVAVISGIFSIVSGSKALRAAASIQDLKSGVDRDLERLKAKLEHGQLISSTQWQAEFNAYQCLWKAVVPVRARVGKLVARDLELKNLGVEAAELPADSRTQSLNRLLEEATRNTRDFMIAVNEHAPFYLAEIREKANRVHLLAHDSTTAHNAKLVRQIRKQELSAEEEKAFKDSDVQRYRLLIAGVDEIEKLIRKRLSTVEVLNHVRPY